MKKTFLIAIIFILISTLSYGAINLGGSSGTTGFSCGLCSNTFLNLDGSNADQNIDIGSYGFSSYYLELNGTSIYDWSSLETDLSNYYNKTEVYNKTEIQDNYVEFNKIVINATTIKGEWLI